MRELAGIQDADRNKRARTNHCQRRKRQAEYSEDAFCRRLEKCRETQSQRHDVSSKQQYSYYADNHLARVVLSTLNSTGAKDRSDDK